MKKAKVTANKQLTEDVFELQFQAEESFSFEAGQFVTFKIDDQVPPCFRAYSIASAPEENGTHFRTCYKVIEGGRGSNWLKSLKENSEINFIGPSGKFVFVNPEKKAFFIATGTGITPFNSMIEDQLKKGNQNQINLLFGVRHIDDIFYQDFYQDLAKEYANLTFKLTLSRPENDSWAGSVGRVSKVLEENSPDTSNTDYYICGLKAMIDDVVTILKAKGVPEESIHFEKFD